MTLAVSGKKVNTTQFQFVCLLVSSTVVELSACASAVYEPLVAEAGERASELGESLIAVSEAMLGGMYDYELGYGWRYASKYDLSRLPAQALIVLAVPIQSQMEW